MSGFGPLRSKVCADIGWPHSGQARSVRTGSGSVSYGPTDAGPANLIRREFQYAYQPPAARIRSRSGGFSELFCAMMISVLKNCYTEVMATRDDLLKLDNQLCFAIVTAARNVVAIYRPVLEPLGLTHPQYLVMLALWERSPRSLGALADELAMEPATLSPLVKRLEAQGRVSRARRNDDERVLDIGLTDQGRALRSEALKVPEQIMARVGVDEGQLAALRDGLAPFVAARS